MRRSITRVVVAAPLALAVGCGVAEEGGDDGRSQDGSAPWECWPEPVASRGAVALGADDGGFVELPEVMPLRAGAAGGFSLALRARIADLHPGDPADALADGNPRTRFAATFADTGEAVEPESRCATSLGYVAVEGATTFELATVVHLWFDVAYRGPELFDRPVEVVVEVIDRDGHHARDARTLTVQAPVDWPEPDAGSM